MLIERMMRPQLLDAAAKRPAVVLTGARQTGKTTLLRQAFPEYEYVSLDLPSEADLAQKDAAEFLWAHRPPLVVDEVQYAPRFFRFVKAFIDNDRRSRGRFILTGSQRFPLMKEVADSLAGRVAVFELEPLSIGEILSAGGRWTTEQILFRGGYPELYEDPGIDSFQFYRSYIATYLERDVRNLLQVGSLRDFERFLRACAMRSGQLLNKADLARDVGISPSTADQWLSTLMTSGQVFLLEPWYSNKTKSMVKSPKLYLSDTGLMATLLNLRTVDEMVRSPFIGALWETHVFSELRKGETARSGSWSMWFWHDRRREVDFVIDRGGRVELVEAKWTEHPDRGDAEALRHLIDKAGAPQVDQARIVCRTRRAYPLEGGITAVRIADLQPSLPRGVMRSAPR